MFLFRNRNKNAVADGGSGEGDKWKPTKAITKAGPNPFDGQVVGQNPKSKSAWYECASEDELENGSPGSSPKGARTMCPGGASTIPQTHITSTPQNNVVISNKSYNESFNNIIFQFSD